MFVINEPELAMYSEKVVPKLWGVEYWLVNNEKYCCKILKILPGCRCSIHTHKRKDETFIGIQGVVELTFHQEAYDRSVIVGPGVKTRIQPGEFHSFQAINPAWVMEVSTPHSDKDVIRIKESEKIEEAKG